MTKSTFEKRNEQVTGNRNTNPVQENNDDESLVSNIVHSDVSSAMPFDHSSNSTQNSGSINDSNNED
jgi:hypothetical protein